MKIIDSIEKVGRNRSVVRFKDECFTRSLRNDHVLDFLREQYDLYPEVRNKTKLYIIQITEIDL